MMCQSIQSTDIAELAYRKRKKYTKYLNLFKGKWLGDSTKRTSIVYFRQQQKKKGQPMESGKSRYKRKRFFG
jgi:hypothetical protein